MPMPCRNWQHYEAKLILRMVCTAELHDVLSVDQADEEEAKRKVAKFRDESNKCAFPGIMSGAARHLVSN